MVPQKQAYKYKILLSSFPSFTLTLCLSSLRYFAHYRSYLYHYLLHCTVYITYISTFSADTYTHEYVAEYQQSLHHARARTQRSLPPEERHRIHGLRRGGKGVRVVFDE